MDAPRMIPTTMAVAWEKRMERRSAECMEARFYHPCTLLMAQMSDGHNLWIIFNESVIRWRNHIPYYGGPMQPQMQVEILLPQVEIKSSEQPVSWPLHMRIAF